jgi:DNA-binding transcriptional LysR family regulator
MPLLEPVPDVRSLDLLHSVAQCGSIRQAALVHGISQPAASMRLRSLEQALGLVLLDRSHGRAQLTPAGVAVVQWSENVLEPLGRFSLSTRALRSEGETQLCLVASMTVAEYLVPQWLTRLRESDPSIVVSLKMGNSHLVVDTMLRDEADVGFVEGPHAPEGLAAKVVCMDDLVVVVAPSDLWARRKRPLEAPELSATPLILREAGSGTRDVLETSLHSLGLVITPLVELGSTTAIKAAVTAGVGAGVLSRFAVESELREGRLVEVITAGFTLERSIRMVWSKGHPLSLSAKRLIKSIDETGPSRTPR